MVTISAADHKRVLGFSGRKLGLAIAIVTVAVLVTLALLHALQERDDRAQAIRTQGLSISRILGGMTLQQLAPDAGNVGILEILGPTLKQDDFAYIAVVDPAGRILRQVTTEGMLVPDNPLNLPPSEWFGESQLVQPDGRAIIEFRAPIMAQNGELAGFARLGYFQPTWGLTLDQLRFIATMILPMFLLVPLLYLPLQRQLRGIGEANQHIKTAIDQGIFNPVELRAEGELAEFIAQFNKLAEQMGQQVNEISHERDQASLSATLLEYQRARTETVLQSLPYGIVALDEACKIIMTNKRALSIFNKTEDAVLDQHASILSDDDHVKGFLSQYDLQSDHAQYNRSLTFESEFAPDKTLQIDALPLLRHDTENALNGSLILIRDVTQERLSLENRSEFVANIAHELKTPLNTLSIYGEALLDRGDSREFRDEAINIIVDEVQRLSTLINNLLRLTKFEMGAMELQRSNVRLSDLLNDAIKQAIPRSVQQGIELEAKIAENMSSINADKEMLRIVLNNLIGNAIKYSDQGDTVTVTASEDDDKIEIRVVDTGIGISREELPFIFDKHFRSQSEAAQQRTGHGLGLPLAQEIINQHHGRITATSELGEGSEFTITLEKSRGILAHNI